jgi:hypothetical protein
VNVPLWVRELTIDFWHEAGEPEPFPRDLSRPITRALPLAIVLLPRLRLDAVQTWLKANGVACPCQEADRPLRACLAARAGHGLIFLDGTDPADEQRFSLAHELGHFLRHYRQPRCLACRHLGAGIAEVLDGERSPTPQERVHALLANVPLGLHLHLMQRGPRRAVVKRDVATAEEEADQVAYELLAPVEAVGAAVGSLGGDLASIRIREVLGAVFGLPLAQAEDYSRLLLPPRWEDPLLRRLRS